MQGNSAHDRPWTMAVCDRNEQPGYTGHRIASNSPSANWSSTPFRRAAKAYYTVIAYRHLGRREDHTVAQRQYHSANAQWRSARHCRIRRLADRAMPICMKLRGMRHSRPHR